MADGKRWKEKGTAAKHEQGLRRWKEWSSPRGVLPELFAVWSVTHLNAAPTLIYAQHLVKHKSLLQIMTKVAQAIGLFPTVPEWIFTRPTMTQFVHFLSKTPFMGPYESILQKHRHLNEEIPRSAAVYSSPFQCVLWERPHAISAFPGMMSLRVYSAFVSCDNCPGVVCRKSLFRNLLEVGSKRCRHVVKKLLETHSFTKGGWFRARDVKSLQRNNISNFGILTILLTFKHPLIKMMTLFAG